MPKSKLPSAPALAGVVQPVRIGFIPLADCAPLLVAEALDLFRKQGVRVELSCEVGWATIREKLLYGQVDAAHAIARQRPTLDPAAAEVADEVAREMRSRLVLAKAVERAGDGDVVHVVPGGL